MNLKRILVGALAFVLTCAGSAFAEKAIVTDGSAFTQPCESADMTAIYHPLKVTGDAMPMEQIFSMADLSAVADLGTTCTELEGLSVAGTFEQDGASHAYAGMDLPCFLTICGMEEASKVTVLSAEGETEINAEEGVIVLSVDGALLENGATLLTEDGACIPSVNGIIVGESNPHYEMHNRAPHDQSADIEFTFSIYRGESETPETTVVYTTAELEALALAHPEAVSGAWYGIIGDKKSIQEMSAGGFLDYFEGLRFDWLMTEELGITDFVGHAVLYGREDNAYAEITDLAYFTLDADAYSMYTADAEEIVGMAIPILAYAKNGSPLLPEHDHDNEACEI